MANSMEYSNVVLASPNGRAAFHIGAARELVENHSFNQVTGTSSSALIALMMALNYHASEIEKTLAKLELTDLYPQPHNQILQATVSNVIQRRFHRNDVTFAQLATGPFRNLRLIVARDENIQTFSALETPNASVLNTTMKASITPGLSTRLADYSKDISSTLYIFNCVGNGPNRHNHLYVPYESNNNVVLGNAGYLTRAPVTTDHEQIQAGMHAVNDILDPLSLHNRSRSVASAFAMGNTSPLSLFSLFSQRNKTPFFAQKRPQPKLGAEPSQHTVKRFK